MVNWDKRYAEADGPLFGARPNNYVVQTVARADFAARRVLCLADGDGRNGRWLAAREFEVTAVDMAGSATKLAVAADRSAEVAVERITGDLAKWAPAAERQWDAAFLIYMHCEEHVRQRTCEIAARHLAPGGWFVAEGFAADYDEGPRMGPADRALLYDAREFERWLPEFEVVEALRGVVRLEEGAKHQGLAQVIRYTARKT